MLHSTQKSAIFSFSNWSMLSTAWSKPLNFLSFHLACHLQWLAGATRAQDSIRAVETIGTVPESSNRAMTVLGDVPKRWPHLLFFRNWCKTHCETYLSNSRKCQFEWALSLAYLESKVVLRCGCHKFQSLKLLKANQGETSWRSLTSFDDCDLSTPANQSSIF